MMAGEGLAHRWKLNLAVKDVHDRNEGAKENINLCY